MRETLRSAEGRVERRLKTMDPELRRALSTLAIRANRTAQEMFDMVCEHAQCQRFPTKGRTASWTVR